MKRQFIVLFLMIISMLSFGQLNINTSMTPSQLVQNVFIGSGVTVSNLTMTGLPMMYGSFTNGSTTNLGINEGIILCTGNIIDIAQSGIGTMSTDQLQAGDADLDAIYTATTYDACVLEFDFIPQDDTIEFHYVFGSEEYPEYVNLSYNDIFAFFISGPNPAGGNYSNQNIALIPGTSTPVSINNINEGYSATCISPGPGCTNCSYYVNNCNGTTIVFDGFTSVLTSRVNVTPCQVYHMKLAIADAGDGIIDSGVFLEASSFSTNAVTVIPTYSNTSLGNNAMEGCSQGIFSFTLPFPSLLPTTINYTVGGTATNGIDYAAIGNSVTIPAGSDSVAVVISPFVDGLTEGTETVTLNVAGTCTTMVYTINIVDNTVLIATATGSTTVCPGSSATLNVSASGGMTPYTYIWSNGGGTGTSATYTPASTTTYTVTVTDNCGQTATDDVTITVANNLSITISPVNPFICQGSSVTLTASGASTYIWSPATGLSSTTGAIVTASPASTQTYTVTGTSAGCTGSTTVTVNVGTNLTINVTPSSPSICPGGSVTLTATSSGIGTNFTWSPGTGLSSTTGATVTASPAVTTTYTVIGTDGNGCTGITSITVTVSSNLSVFITNITDATCGQANGSATVTPAGGTPPYSCNWSDGSNTQTMLNVPAGLYYVTVTDANGCTATLSVTIADIPCLAPEICMVTIDTATNKNIIIWEKPVTTAIEEYYIYRESSVSGIYNLIGTQNYSVYSAFIDTTSNSLQQPYRYKLAFIDTSGLTSQQSDYHQTIHLTVYSGTGGSWSLVWNNYEGFSFSTYNIYRGSSSSNMTLLNSVSSSINSYTDVSPPPGTMYYLVEAVKPTPCIPSLKTINNYNSTISNIASTNPAGINDFMEERNINIYPNPGNGIFTILFSNKTNESVSVEILNSLGQLVYTDIMNTSTKEIDLSELSKGTYSLKLTTEGKSYFEKIVIE
jgi:hypothetical protein